MPAPAGIVVSGEKQANSLAWTALHPAGAVAALIVWGLCGWGLIVPQQHRLVQLSPQGAPLVLALNNSATYSLTPAVLFHSCY